MKVNDGMTRRGFIKLAAVASGILLTQLNFIKRAYAYISVKAERTRGTYDQDAAMALRKSRDNPEIQQI